MMESSRTYLPAAGNDWSLVFYDPMVKLLGGERVVRTLLDQAELRPGMRVLDVGCGTGTLAVMAKRLYREVDVTGVDPDPKALARARRKAERARVSIQFDRGFGDAPTYAEKAFDRIFSSFMFHHLPANEKGKTLEAIRRVLKPGGSFHMVDFEGPGDAGGSFLGHFLHSGPRLQDNTASKVLGSLREAGFVDAKKIGRRKMLLGAVAFYRAMGTSDLGC